MNFDSSKWGLPLAVLGAGALFGVIRAIRARGSDRDARTIAGEGKRNDLEEAHAMAVRALRDLEAEKDKLAPDEYAQQRADLLARGGSALRQLEEGNSETVSQLAPDLVATLRAERERLGEDGWNAALAAAGLAPAAAPQAPAGLAPEWRGAAWMFSIFAVIGALYWSAQEQAAPRTEGAPMTGGTATPAPPPSAEEQALRAKLESNPNDLESLNRLTVLALTNSDLNGAMQWNSRAVEAAPKDPDARTFRAVLRAATGMGDTALTLLDEVLAESPEHTMALVYKGLIALEQGKNDVAIGALEKALALDPPNPSFLEAKLAQARGQGPMEMPNGAAPSAAGPAEPIASGTITLDPSVDASTYQAVFVSVRDPAGGPPLAARKLPPGPFPLEFSITTADRLPMGGDRPLPSVVNVSVRLDADGDAMSRSDAEPTVQFTGTKVGTAALSAVLK